MSQDPREVSFRDQLRRGGREWTGAVDVEARTRRCEELLRSLDEVFITSEIGRPRPEREIFEYVLAESGNPVQANAAGNEDAARLKREYGRRIVFHGNTNNQGVFHKSRDQVVADALYRIRHLAPGGGYIFSSGHNIQANMPAENIVALFDTARAYGAYPIDTERIDRKLDELIQRRPEIRENLPL